MSLIFLSSFLAIFFSFSNLSAASQHRANSASFATSSRHNIKKSGFRHSKAKRAFLEFAQKDLPKLHPTQWKDALGNSFKKAGVSRQEAIQFVPNYGRVMTSKETGFVDKQVKKVVRRLANDRVKKQNMSQEKALNESQELVDSCMLDIVLKYSARQGII